MFHSPDANLFGFIIFCFSFGLTEDRNSLATESKLWLISHSYHILSIAPWHTHLLFRSICIPIYPCTLPFVHLTICAPIYQCTYPFIYHTIYFKYGCRCLFFTMFIYIDKFSYHFALTLFTLHVGTKLDKIFLYVSPENTHLLCNGKYHLFGFSCFVELKL